VVHPLPQKFEGWLSSILFLLWHVEIINKDNEFFARRRAENAFSTFLKLLVECVLCLICGSLGGECKGDRLEILGHLKIQQITNINSLSRTCGTGAQHVLRVKKQ
jgi:hypothetical protein